MHRKYSIQIAKSKKKQNLIGNHLHQAEIRSQSYQQKQRNDREVLNNFQSSTSLKKNSFRLNQSKSEQKAASMNTLYKQRIVRQRRSFSLIQKSKTHNINQTSRNQRYQSHKQSFDLKNTDKKSIGPDMIVMAFTSQCFSLEKKYIQSCEKSAFNACFEYLVALLNFTIDIDMPKWFLKIVSIICQFYQIIEQPRNAMRFYQELREAAILQKDYKYVIISLVGLARCASQGSNLTTQPIKILKKALQYAWYINSTQLELNIYDELGQKYYKLGEVERASAYHKKYANSITEPKNSPLRLLSKQKMEILQQKYVTVTYENFSLVYLTHLSLPIKSAHIFPPFIQGLLTIRNQISETHKFNFEAQQIHYQTRRVLKAWIFQTQTEQPNLQNAQKQQNQNMHKQKKYGYISLRARRQVKSKQIKLASKVCFQSKLQNDDQFAKKETLDEQVKKFIQRPGLQKNWYESIVKKVMYNQSRQFSHLSDPVRLTKNITKLRHKKQSLKVLFKQIIGYFTSQKMKHFLFTKTLMQKIS